MRNELKEDEKFVKKMIMVHLRELYQAYNIEVSTSHLSKDIGIISDFLKNKPYVTKEKLQITYREILTNYTLYRRMNAAVYITAFQDIVK